jgi:hypothetical protein
MVNIGPPEIRRLPSGAIDTAFYVLHAQRARARAAAAFFRCIGQWLRGTAAAGRPGEPAPPKPRSCLGTKNAAI